MFILPKIKNKKEGRRKDHVKYLSFNDKNLQIDLK